MKIYNFLLGSIIALTLTLMGCGDYEDTETISPGAAADAIGVSFSSANIKVVNHPKETMLELTLNRINTKKAITVPVKVKDCAEVSTGVKFCEQPTAFVFEVGKAKATVMLKANPACLFQKTYTMTLSIGDGKDHPYASGTSETKVTFMIDYTWTKLGQPVILETGWFDAGILAPIEHASNYENENDKEKKLVRIKAVYAYAYTDVPTTAGHIQFYLDKDYNPQGMFTSIPAGYDPEAIKTGVVIDKTDYSLKMIDISRGIDDKGQKTNAYTFDYDVNSTIDNVVKKEKTVKATLDFDFKKVMEED